MEKEEEADRLRLVICIVGVSVLFAVICCGIRQLALLEERIARDHLYEQLDQELTDLTDDRLDEFTEEKEDSNETVYM